MKYGRTFNFSADSCHDAGACSGGDPRRDDELSGQRHVRHGNEPPLQGVPADRRRAQADLRKLMNIPDNYKALFIQGGGTLQFAMVAMNLMKNGKACYVETGAWSKKAIAEAKKYGEVQVVASSADKNFSYIPDCSDLDIPEDADYVYICENETINGTTWNKLPQHQGPHSGVRPVLHVPVPPLQRGRLRPDLEAGVQKNVPRRYGRGHHPGGPDPGRPGSQDPHLYEV